ncbi:MAG: DctP family TRAP transporter solute-binding subunit, partial [Candidatus Accumulibacter sp.]|nr:DctP family TRAP transporter solute-binding subunit [Accumulibacter sp.]
EAIAIRAGIGLDERSSQYKGLLKFKERFESESGGRLRVDLFTDVRLGDDTETGMLTELRDGTLEMACNSTLSIAALDGKWRIFDLPFLFPDEETADRVLDGPLGRAYLDSLLAHGIIGLAFWESGFSVLTNGARVIESPSHLKGLKIGTTASPIHQAAFESMGAKPVPMLSDQRYPALAQKMIDAQESPPTTNSLQKYHEAQGYLTLTHHFYSPYVFMYGKKLWDTLSAEDQAVIFGAAQEAGRYQRKVNREAVGRALSDMSAAGVVVTDLGSAQREAFMKAVKGIAPRFESVFGADEYEALKKEIARKPD